MAKSGEKWGIVAKSREKWQKVAKSGEKWDLFCNMAAPAILDDQKSLSIAFLAISDQYATFFFLIFFFQMAASGHFGSPICAKNNRVLPLCVINGYAKYEVDR